jgi:hypothetical protein
MGLNEQNIFKRRSKMALAQVVYHISRDTDFAAQMRSDPEGALAQRGFKLSKEEFAFLSRGLFRTSREKVSLEDLATKAAIGWR